MGVGILLIEDRGLSQPPPPPPPPPTPPTYTTTVHGNSTLRSNPSSGVDRSVVTPGYTYTTKGLCAHCHEQHASIDGAEPTPPVAEGASQYALFRTNYGANKNELCFACHQTFIFTSDSNALTYGRYGIYQGKTKYNNSIHYSSGSMIWSPDPSPPGPPYDDAGNCHNCHNPHGYSDSIGLIPSMLFARDSKTGDSPAYEMGCETCHDGSQGGSSKNIQTQLNKIYSHPTHTYKDRHVLPEKGQSEGGSSFGPTNRHAECVDCHNPHALGTNGTTHTPQTSGNAVSDVLKNVWGVEPTWPSRWTQPTTFTVRKPPTYTDGSLYEYQICFKCHSYYGLGTLTNAVSTIVGPSGTYITDQAWEFNVNNRSAHPVVVGLSSQTGSPTPKALASTQMSSPWTTVGTQKMYCSDCHGADDESTYANGPHGSARKYMLKGTRQYWPASSTGKLFSLNDLSGDDSSGEGLNPYATWSTQLFCMNCHPMGTISGGVITTWYNDLHKDHKGRDYTPGAVKRNVYCIACHTVIPHGMKRSRMQVYDNRNTKYGTDVEPYRYVSGGVTYAAVSGFKKPTTSPSKDNYSKDNCWSTVNGCTTHSDQGGYETN